VMLLPHPAASNPAARTAATREGLVVERRMLILPAGVHGTPPEPAPPAARMLTGLVTAPVADARMAWPLGLPPRRPRLDGICLRTQS
jgi:hypothetical protein